MDFYYFDAAAHEAPLPEAIAAFEENLYLANPSSLHEAGRYAKSKLEEARATIARCIGADPNEVYFTSGATEACNWAIRSLEAEKKIVCFQPIEHHAVTSVPLTTNTRFTGYAMVHQLANNETGEIFDLSPVRQSCPSDSLFCDATAAVGQIPVNFHDLGMDYMAFGAHKFGALSGIGCMIARDGAPIHSMICGGGQERDRRGGTESVALACAMAAALEKRCQTMYDDIARITELRDLFIETILREIPQSYVNGPWIVCDATRRLPNNANISFLGVESQSLVLALSKAGVFASSGSACTSGNLEGSYVLSAMGYSDERVRSAVRFTLPYEVKRKDVEDVCQIVIDTVKRLRAMSPMP